MDIKRVVERMYEAAGNEYASSLSRVEIEEAATALSTLQCENVALKNRLRILETETKQRDMVLRMIRTARDKLNKAAPTPWSVKADDLSGYIYDVEGNALFGGELGEGYIDPDAPVVQALLQFINTMNLKGVVSWT